MKNCQDKVSTGQVIKPFAPCSPKKQGNYVVNDFESNALLRTNGAGQVITDKSKYYFDAQGNLHIVGDVYVQTLYYDNLNPPVSGGGGSLISQTGITTTFQDNLLKGVPFSKLLIFNAGTEQKTSNNALESGYDISTGTITFEQDLGGGASNITAVMILS